MHPVLLQVLTDDRLEAPVRALFAYVYAHTNGVGSCQVEKAKVLADLGVSESTLRRYRGTLASAGVASSTLTGESLVFVVDPELWERNQAAGHEAAPQSVHVVHADEDERAPHARSVHDARADEGGERAPHARSVHHTRAERAPHARSVHDARADEGGERAPHARNVHDTRETCTTRALDGCIDQIDRYIDTIPDNGDQSMALVAGGVVDDGMPGPDEVERTVRLLTDELLGINDRVARRVAEKHRFCWVLAQVFTWRHEVAAGKTHLAPGAVVHRCDQGWRVDALSEADRKTEFFKRHVPRWEQLERQGVVNRYVPEGYEGIIEH